METNHCCGVKELPYNTIDFQRGDVIAGVTGFAPVKQPSVIYLLSFGRSAWLGGRNFTVLPSAFGPRKRDTATTSTGTRSHRSKASRRLDRSLKVKIHCPTTLKRWFQPREFAMPLCKCFEPRAGGREQLALEHLQHVSAHRPRVCCRENDRIATAWSIASVTQLGRILYLREESARRER